MDVIDLHLLDGTNGVRIDGLDELGIPNRAVRNAGDINGDGFDDIIVSDPGNPSAEDKHGDAFVIFGRPAGEPVSADVNDLDGTNGFHIRGLSPVDGFARSFSGAGDVNGDGLQDLVISADGADFSSGEVYVVFGPQEGFPAQVDLTDLDGSNGFIFEGTDSSEGVGTLVTSAGDFNADGFDDIIVTASPPDADDLEKGDAYIIFGTTDGFPERLTPAELDGTNGVRFKIPGLDEGYGASSVGDVNNDGIDDIIFSGGRVGSEGNVDILFGSAEPFPASIDLGDQVIANGFSIQGIATSNYFGSSVSGAGDFNGDGIDDFVVGSSLAGEETNFPTGGTANLMAGDVSVIFGSTDPFPDSFDIDALDGSNGFRVKGLGRFFNLGKSVSDIGDFNGDGFDDVAVSASGGLASAPLTYILFGSSAGFPALTDVESLDSSMALRIDGKSQWRQQQVSSAGDFNNDGFDDLLIGEHRDAYIIYGFDTDPDPSIDFQGTDANETVDGSVGNDSLSGNGGKDKLTGLEGEDTLEGGEGHDTLDGGAGADTILAGAGRRDYIMVTGNDAEADIRHSGGEGERDTIRNTQAGADFTLSNVNNDTNDDGVADFNAGIGTISGGIEHIRGEGGKLLGNADINYFNFAGTSLGLRQVNTLQGDDTVIGSDISNKRTYLLGDGDDSFNGTGDRRDIVDGGDDNDLIDTGAGRDSLAGGLGEDTLLAGDGNDVIQVSGDDGLADARISGGEGVDRIYNLDAGADFALSNVNNDTDDDGVADFNAGTGTVSGGIEQISGRGGNLTGDDQANYFDLSAVVLRTSSVSMLGGNDTVIASSHGNKRSYDLGEGNDSFQGTGSVKDTVLGGAGDDTIAGGEGNDRLDGGAGTNELTGGEGDDMFIFTVTAQSETTVTDFDQAGNDRLNIRDFGYENLAAVKAVAEQIGSDVKIDLDATNSVVLRDTDIDSLQNGDFIFA